MIAKKYRIDRQRIPYILQKGHSHRSALFILRYLNNEESTYRFRTIVSKKIGKKAVERNKIRRQIYEAISLAIKELNKDSKQNSQLDVIFIPKKIINQHSFREIAQDVKDVITNPQKLIHNGKV